MKTIYTPIAVSSGELPPLNVDFIGIDIKGEVDNYFFSSYVNFEKYFIKEWLKKEEVPELTEWISVKDKLPEFDKLVMVFGVRKLSQPNMGGNPPQVTFTQRQNLFGTSLEESKFRYVDKNDFRLMEDVTHWQYLPEPPSKVEVKGMII